MRRGVFILGAVVLLAAAAFLGRRQLLELAYRVEGAAALRLGYRPAVARILYPTDESWTQAHRLIAHALGGLQGCSYTNSREAFLENYARGFRVFEVDLLTTSDGALVAKHDWDVEKRKLSLQEFMTARVQGRFTPLNLDDVLILLRDHGDASLVLDIKDRFYPVLTEVVERAGHLDPNLLRRIIPQLYSERDLTWALRCYPFPSLIYTLYFTQATDDEVVRFVKQSGVRVVTMSDTRYRPELVRRLAEQKALVYVHTINALEKAVGYRAEGVHGVYTDFLAPGDLR